jgi:hypothetical protein
MKLPARIFWMVCALAIAAWAAAQSSDRSVSPTSEPANGLRIAPSDPTEVPITLPTSIKPSGKRRTVFPGGVMIIDRVASIAKDATGQWNTIKDPRVGVMYLLPCESLEAVEKELAENPEAKFKLSGEIHRYRGGYYMLLHRALLIMKSTSSAPAATSRPTTKPPAVSLVEPAAATSTTRPTEPTSQPAASRPAEASADDVAAELLGKTPSRPIVPVVKPKLPKIEPSASGATSGRPLQAGPGKNAVHRLARLLYREEGQKWSRVAFEADNTLREPPMRVLPNIYLERMETLSNNGKAFGAVFHISGEVYRYKGMDYLLLRAVIKKHHLGQL